MNFNSIDSWNCGFQSVLSLYHRQKLESIFLGLFSKRSKHGSKFFYGPLNFVPSTLLSNHSAVSFGFGRVGRHENMTTTENEHNEASLDGFIMIWTSEPSTPAHLEIQELGLSSPGVVPDADNWLNGSGRWQQENFFPRPFNHCSLEGKPQDF